MVPFSTKPANALRTEEAQAPQTIPGSSSFTSWMSAGSIVSLDSTVVVVDEASGLSTAGVSVVVVAVSPVPPQPIDSRHATESVAKVIRIGFHPFWNSLVSLCRQNSQRYRRPQRPQLATPKM